MLDYFDRVLDATESARGGNRTRILALCQRLQQASEGFEQARDALGPGNIPGYLAALDLLVECYPL